MESLPSAGPRSHEATAPRKRCRFYRGRGPPPGACVRSGRGRGCARARVRLQFPKRWGIIEKAQQIAAYESPRTTKLYDRTADQITLDEIERIAI